MEKTAIRTGTGFRYLAPPAPCEFLPGRVWQMEYEFPTALTPALCMQRIEEGWRHFGGVLYRPRCPTCTACQSLRVDVQRFRPSRSQRRVRRANEEVVRLSIGRPSVTREKMELFDRYHEYQVTARNWPERPGNDAAGYQNAFVMRGFPRTEWTYTLADKLVGVGYVDELPGGLSAAYFFYDPDERDRGLGCWNILSLLEVSARRGLAWLYLGYYVEEYGSLAYKSKYVPNQVRSGDGAWRDYRS
jgi:arginyl-tRNA--protein-N-Asp/Glu arginylyltransferase